MTNAERTVEELAINIRRQTRDLINYLNFEQRDNAIIDFANQIDALAS